MTVLLRLNTALRRRLSGERGAVTVEFGIVVILFVTLISGLFELGMASSMRMALTNGAREGVRVYSLVDGGDWQTVTTTSAGVAGATAVSSGNCPTPSTPPNPAPQAWVEARRDHQISIAFIPAINITITGRAVMRCGG